MESAGCVFKGLFIDLEVRCACKLFLYNLLIVKFSTPGKVMINKGFSLFVYTIYLQQYIDIVRCVIFLLFYVFLCFV